MNARPVVILAYDRLQSLDAVGPFEVFAGATKVAEARGLPFAYQPAVASVSGDPVTAESGLHLVTEPLPDAGQPLDTLVVPGGQGVDTARRDPALVGWIASAAGRARRVASVCSGSFLVAQAGLLEGRTVTTHWARATQLATEFPEVHVDADPIYVRDGKYWSSAGVTAGIDLALALVEQDLGVDVAQTVARWLVMFLHRPGGQSQFASPVWVPRAERSAVRAVQGLVEANPSADHRLPTMAAAAAMSVRHFARVFKSEVGETPARFVERVRLESARAELERTGDNLGVIAARCGLGSAETLRRVFLRHLHTTPDGYRRRFATGWSDRERTSA